MSLVHWSLSLAPQEPMLQTYSFPFQNMSQCGTMASVGTVRGDDDSYVYSQSVATVLNPFDQNNFLIILSFARFL